MAKSPRYWDVWTLPRPARALVIAVPCAYVAVITLVAFHTNFRLRDAGIAAAFTLAAVASIEISMRLAWPRTRNDRLSRDCLTAWFLPVALLLPPLYVAVVVVVACLYVRARVWRAQPMKLIYNIASIGLAYAAAAEVHVAHRTSRSAFVDDDQAHRQPARRSRVGRCGRRVVDRAQFLGLLDRRADGRLRFGQDVRA